MSKNEEKTTSNENISPMKKEKKSAEKLKKSSEKL